MDPSKRDQCQGRQVEVNVSVGFEFTLIRSSVPTPRAKLIFIKYSHRGLVTPSHSFGPGGGSGGGATGSRGPLFTWDFVVFFDSLITR